MELQNFYVKAERQVLPLFVTLLVTLLGPAAAARSAFAESRSARRSASAFCLSAAASSAATIGPSDRTHPRVRSTMTPLNLLGAVSFARLAT